MFYHQRVPLASHARSAASMSLAVPLAPVKRGFLGVCPPQRIEFWAMDPELISKVMREMGRKGGKKGGKRGARVRNERLTPEQRSQIARKAAKTRWAKTKKMGKHTTRETPATR